MLLRFSKLELELPNLRKLDIKLNSELELHIIKSSSIHTKPEFIRIIIRMVNIRTPRLSHFALYNYPRWLKTHSGGVNVFALCFQQR